MIDTIRTLWEKLPLMQYYTWSVPANCPVTIPRHIMGPYDRNVYLKSQFSTRLQDPNNWADCFWLIQDWGGIKTFKDNERNRERIQSFRAQLGKKQLTRDSHSRLPSLSKLAAFGYPNVYSIYDSRAVFSLNWLLFCHQENPALFPQPPGRSKSLTELDTQTLFRLSGRNYTVRSYKTAYFEYCDMLKALSQKGLNKKQPFYLEMLLFVAAQEWIPSDIRGRTTVTIS